VRTSLDSEELGPLKERVGSRKVESDSRERERRRAFLFLSALLAALMTNALATEGDMLVTAFDDVAILVLGLFEISVIALQWRKRPRPQLRRANDMMSIVGLWVVVFAISAFEVEAGFSEDLADEVPALLIGLAMVVNRLI
jgi:peptidoglycan/LPS O-acetylase OafA/YrhL